MNEDIGLLMAWPSLDEGCEAAGRMLAEMVSSAREGGRRAVTLDIDVAENMGLHMASAGLLLARYDERYGE